MKKSTVLPDGDGNYSSPERDCQRQKRAEGNEGEGKFAITDCIKQSDILEAVNRLKNKESFSAIDVLRECDAEPGLYVDALRHLLNLSENHKINLFVYNGTDFNRCGFWFSH